MMNAPTERLYYDDAYLTAFDARVTESRADGWVALDRSAFYPTSGGQPNDTGSLTANGRVYPVTDVQIENGVVWHLIGQTLPVGTAVHGAIDWQRRFDHMQQHAGDHLLAGAAWRLFGAVTIGLHVSAQESTIDMTLPDGRTRLTDAEMAQLERLANEHVQRDLPIRCWFPSSQELSALPLRKQPTVSEHVRIVAMGDVEMVPCGGTHPSTTGQIGSIKILSCAPARGKMRLTFVSGMRAVTAMSQAYHCAREMAAALSSDFESAPLMLARERENAARERQALTERLESAALSLLHQNAKKGKTGAVYALHLSFATPDTLQSAAKALCQEPGAIVLLSCPGKSGRTLLFAKNALAEWDMASLLRQCGARGGGKPDWAQGSAENESALDVALTFVLAHTDC